MKLSLRPVARSERAARAPAPSAARRASPCLPGAREAARCPAPWWMRSTSPSCAARAACSRASTAAPAWAPGPSSPSCAPTSPAMTCASSTRPPRRARAIPHVREHVPERMLTVWLAAGPVALDGLRDLRTAEERRHGGRGRRGGHARGPARRQGRDAHLRGAGRPAPAAPGRSRRTRGPSPSALRGRRRRRCERRAARGGRDPDRPARARCQPGGDRVGLRRPPGGLGEAFGRAGRAPHGAGARDPRSRARTPCPTWAGWPWSTPRRAGAWRWTPEAVGCARALPPPRPISAPRWRVRCAAPGPITWCCPPRAPGPGRSEGACDELRLPRVARCTCGGPAAGRPVRGGTAARPPLRHPLPRRPDAGAARPVRGRVAAPHTAGSVPDLARRACAGAGPAARHRRGAERAGHDHPGHRRVALHARQGR